MNPKQFNEIVEELIEYVPRCKTNRADSHHEDLMLPQAKPTLTRCDDCVKMVINPRKKIWIKNLGGRYPKWAKKCLTCKKEVEITGGFIVKYK
jgi:hypothetical protein